MTQNLPRALAPRRLEQQETLQNLNHWRGVLQNFYRRCQYYSHFLTPNLRWGPSEDRGFRTETTGLKRSAEVLASDLDGFLESIASYLPFDYVSDSLKTRARCMKDVWDIIYEIYDAELDTTHYLDYATMHRDPQESYRNFFNRLVGFVRQHLPRSEYTAEGVSSGADGEAMSISLLDSIAIHWLLSIDRRLINIVKTEFSSELKSKRLCQMIKPIASNIDELLNRYNAKDTVNIIKPASISDSSVTNSDSPMVDMLINRIERLENSQSKRSFYKGRNKSSNFNKSQKYETCVHCSFLNRQLGSNLATNHSSHRCSKKKFSVSFIESVDDRITDTESSEPELQEGGSTSPPRILMNSLQINTQKSSPSSTPTQDFNRINVNKLHSNKTVQSTVDYNDCKSFEANDISEVNGPVLDNYVGMECETTNTHNIKLFADIRTLSSSAYEWKNIQKATSPRISCTFNKIDFDALLDSGAEINVLDESFTKQAGIGIIGTNHRAQAANRLPLEICGQTEAPVSIWCNTDEGSKQIHLGIVLVVRNLGTFCLIGEPGKTVNNIICLPKKQLVILAGGDEIHHAPYVTDKKKYTLARAPAARLLLPGEQIQYDLPANMFNVSFVAVTPRPTAASWLKPAVLETSCGSVYLTNSSTIPVRVKKAEHLADIRDTCEFQVRTDLPPTAKYHDDQFQFKDLATTREKPDKYLHLLKVDPDRIL